MSISSRLTGRDFPAMPPFTAALSAGVNDELEPIRRELARLNAEIQVVRQLAENAQRSADSAQQTANLALQEARRALTRISSLSTAG
jgi:predicted  nucleic acid-binding Zn-ribbon protein